MSTSNGRYRSAAMVAIVARTEDNNFRNESDAIAARIAKECPEVQRLIETLVFEFNGVGESTALSILLELALVLEAKS